MKIMHKNNIVLSSHVLFINHISRHFFLLEYFLLQKMKKNIYLKQHCFDSYGDMQTVCNQINV